ncbi:MAG: WD40 repeat domain-containing protein, partial [Armatimonadetes bacterium]|nr:WD40 repeat domain-containing protein [Armatimonadota bacterium]
QQARESDDHLAFVRNRLLKAHDDLAAVLDLYRQVQSGRNIVDDETNPLCAVLKLSGVCREEQGRLRVRNRVYARVFDRAWLEAQLPNAEVERQKAAYRRGLVRASALAGVVLALMAGLTGWAMRSDRASRRAAREARSQTALARESEARAQWLGYSSAMDIIQHEWDSNTLYHAPELLDATEHNPYRGFEWGYWNRLCHAETGVLRGHSGEIAWAEFSRDGRRVVTGSWDQTARVWDVSTGRPLLELRGHTHIVNVATFSPDERLILTASADKTLCLWDAATGRRLHTLTGHTEGINVAFFSPDGARIVSASDDRTAKVWETGSGRALLTLSGHADYLWGARFSPDGRHVVTASFDGTARLWDATRGRLLHVLKGHVSRVGVPEKGVAGAAFSPDSRRVATSGADGTVRLWDAATGEALRVLKVSADPIYSAEFTPDGKRLWIAGKDRTARLWEAEPGRELRVIRGHTARVWYAVYSPDGKQVLTCTAATVPPGSGMRRRTMRRHLCGAMDRQSSTWRARGMGGAS